MADYRQVLIQRSERAGPTDRFKDSMAVYTVVSLQQVNDLLADFELGQATALHGISGGIENTNYFVDIELASKTTRYVLTLFEEISPDEVPFFVELGTWLADRDVPVSYAIADRNGIGLKQLCGKPAILQPCYSGDHIKRNALTPDHCAQIGAMLARYHQAGSEFYMKRQAHRGVFWLRRESSRLASQIPAEDAALLKSEVDAFDQLRETADLPMGIIHGDLFHDNALFDNNQLTAVLDIYNAATAYLLFDLAIVANDWCINADLQIDPAKEQALLEGYASVRAFTAAEREAWALLTRTAAMRFWLSRLEPWVEAQQGKGSGKTLLDPNEYKQILLHRIQTPSLLP